MNCKARARSRWREFCFGFHQVAQAIEPRITLKQTIDTWNDIAGKLAESPRKRITQENQIFKTS
jgi:hypothetical protein